MRRRPRRRANRPAGAASARSPPRIGPGGRSSPSASRPCPPPPAASWVRNDVDRFILARLQAEGLRPSPEAGRRPLDPPGHFDLTGLPPTTGGGRRVRRRPLAGRLRDAWSTGCWPARATASAGRRTGSTSSATPSPTATASTTTGPTPGATATTSSARSTTTSPTTASSASSSPATSCAPTTRTRWSPPATCGTASTSTTSATCAAQWDDMLNDLTDVTGDVFLGLGMGCARCHDHKFDPILQKDYYRLQAFFAAVLPRDDVPLATPQQKADVRRRSGRGRQGRHGLCPQADRGHRGAVPRQGRGRTSTRSFPTTSRR